VTKTGKRTTLETRIVISCVVNKSYVYYSERQRRFTQQSNFKVSPRLSTEPRPCTSQRSI